MEPQTATYKISGMHCHNCVRSVKNAIARVSADLEVDVSLEQGTATVRGPHDAAAVKQAIEDIGYDCG